MAKTRVRTNQYSVEDQIYRSAVKQQKSGKELTDAQRAYIRKYKSVNNERKSREELAAQKRYMFDRKRGDPKDKRVSDLLSETRPNDIIKVEEGGGFNKNSNRNKKSEPFSKRMNEKVLQARELDDANGKYVIKKNNKAMRRGKQK